MLKIIMKTFVILYISLLSSLNALSTDLNYISLYGLRDQHSFNGQTRGKTRIEINSSKRFIDLYNSLESDGIEEIEEGVEDAFNHPYYAKALFSQTIILGEFVLEAKAQDFIVAEINNPVFPELYLLNIRTDSASIQKTFKNKKYEFLSKLSYMNRWYINEVYSLEEVVTDNLELNLKNAETYTPFYFDFQGSYKNDKYEYNIKMSGLELTNKDKYDYYEVRAQAQGKFSDKFKLFIDAPLVFIGNYSFFDDLVFGINYILLENVSLSGTLSKMKSEIGVDAYWENIFLESKVIRVRKSYFEEKYINNFMLSLGVRY